MSDVISRVRKKIADGQRIGDDDALQLFESDDLFGIGQLAADINRQKNGDKVLFNVNRHINYTNFCVNQCLFCAFCHQAGDSGGYTYNLSEILNKAAEASAAGATELHMVGGLHPDLPFEFYLRMMATIKANNPHLKIKAFTAVEIDYFSQISKLPVEEVISELKRLGLDSTPGGGAEILCAEVRNQICPEKISGERWLEVTQKIHEGGLKSNATMLFGHVEGYADRVDHMAKLRALQDKTGGFQSFIPLAFQPANTRIPNAKGPDGIDCLKTLAIGRIYLDNFQHIKAYWVMLGLKIAQVALSFGVNDLDGTVVEEKIGHDAGADSPQALDKHEILRQIRNAGKIPVERDTLYRQVRIYDHVEDDD
ncbi:MAG: aminofutalosine synthase MqnE [Thermodesulfobacteriota bacterium]|nr:aminofutalosine synthase MqnE [Thermodesulfobacteriota bacterium]